MKRIHAVFPWIIMTVLLLLRVDGSAAQGAPMDLGKALKIGSGKTVVIEFTDPDCPYCRRGAAYFSGRQDVTRYIFLNPLPMHPQAKDKALYILSAPDQAKAYEEAMTGGLDGRQLTGITDRGKKLLEEHLAIAQEAGMDSTPAYIICGRIIHGLDQVKIEMILGK
jgi:thiol:disulfide interchange protein DsbC